MKRFKRILRSHEFPHGCKHEFRLLTEYRGYFIFYCVKCLLYTLKDADTDFKEWIRKEKLRKKKT